MQSARSIGLHYQADAVSRRVRRIKNSFSSYAAQREKPVVS
jgi:hypothetical protein